MTPGEDINDKLSGIEKQSIMPSEAAKQSWINFISR
jgi:hypothetical protein